MDKELAARIEELRGYGFAFAPVRILAAAVELGIFPSLTEAITPDELARRKGLSSKGAYRLLEALVSLSVVTREGDRYRLDESARELFQPSSPFYLGDYFLHVQNLQGMWSHLSQVIETGEPVERKRDPRFPAVLAKGLFPLHWSQALSLEEELPPVQEGTVLDVAGGSGVWSAGILHRRPGLQGVLLDLPIVVEEAARPILEKLHLLDRYSFIPGDMFQVSWGEGHSCVILGHICHALGEEDIQRLLSRSLGALSSQGILMMVDFLRERGAPFVSFFSLNMLMATQEGDVYSLDQYGHWLSKAGFRVLDVILVHEAWGSVAILAAPV